MSKEYTADFFMQGFSLVKKMTGEPPITCGFSFPAEAEMGDGNKSLSVYFKLRNFDGKTAFYTFYNWREMGGLYKATLTPDVKKKG